MNPRVHAIRLALRRGWIEFRQSFTSPQDLWNYFGFSLVFLFVLMFQRPFLDGADMPGIAGTSLSYLAVTVPGVVAMLLVTGSVLSTAQFLTAEREDGTLLRAKAMPRGMTGYMGGKVLCVSAMTLLSMLVFLVPSILVFDGLPSGDTSGLLVLLWSVPLGILATMPLGAILGSLLPSPRAAMGVTVLPLMVVCLISGVFFPIDVMPEAVQVLAQVFPVYWLAMSMRSAFLPDALASVEIGESWRHLEAAGVLGAWAVAGLLIAPFVLRRMARRESGAVVEQRRHKAMQRVA
ncbi:ABC transporter permease [Salinactinospora qingdaonensis]|uniref:Transport permease protein n=1 Tax=Salinactinospora qingdaonensis TaxID=702744 RepID=A0ABP7F580_9ACTN